jgi:type I restriction enzyme S subunit
MRLLKIKDIGRIISGSTPDTNIEAYWNGNIPWVTPREINRLDTPFLNDTERKITADGLKNCSTILLPKGSILFTSRAPIGLVAIANIDVATNQGFKSIRLFDGFYPLYVYYTLKYFSKRIDYLGTGTTFKELSKSSFEEFEIPFPEKFEDQIRIAKIINKVDLIIQQRKKSITFLNDLLKNTFLETFGDPIWNKKGWEKKALESIVSKECPLTYGIVQPGDEFSNGVPVVRPVDLFKSHINRENLKLIDPKISDKFKRTILKGNEILMCVRGSTGIVALAEEELKGCNVTRGIVPIWFNSDYNREFAFQLLGSTQINREIQKYTYGSALKQINLSDLRKLELINPPPNLQDNFGELARKTFIIKKNLENSLTSFEDLYSSINQQAFKGILNYSHIPIGENEADLFREQASDALREFQSINSKSATIKVKSKIASPEKKHSREKLIWENVAVETIANWIKHKYYGYHFNIEMLCHFLLNDHVTVLNYFSSEDLKKTPSLNSKDDIKKFLFSALNKEMPFLEIKQQFYNADAKNLTINLTDDDIELIKDRSNEEISGIYFSIETI